MKTTRLCIGIISMVLFLVIMFQSCAAGIGENPSRCMGAASVSVAVVRLSRCLERLGARGCRFGEEIAHVSVEVVAHGESLIDTRRAALLPRVDGLRVDAHGLCKRFLGHALADHF